VFALLVLARFARSGQLMRFNYWAAFFLLPSLHDLQNHQILAYSWTMVFEVFFYLVLGLILCRIVRGAVPILIGLLIASVVAGAFWDIRRPLWIIVCNPILLEFVFGAILALIYDRVGQWRRLGIGLTVIGVCATILLNTHNPAGVAMSPQIILIDQGVFLRVATWGVCALLLVSGVVLWSPSMEHPVSRCWVILGNASYSVYITSALTLEVCGRVYLRVFRTAFSLPSRIGYQLGLTLIALAVGYLCYRFIEKPMLDALQNRFLRKNKRKVMLMVVVVPEPAASPGAQRGVAAPGGD
jgi:exopolysaccharide production protein ExoZ